MNGFVTASRYATTCDIPIQLPQTELRRGRYIVAGQVRLILGQTMRVRPLSLHFISVLTAGVTPIALTTGTGIISAGVYLGPMLCSSPLILRSFSPSIITMNPFQYRDFSTPGIYSFIVSNNTQNVDVTAALTGVAKIFG